MSLAFLLDTDVCVEAIRRRPSPLRNLFEAEADALCTSTVVLSELLRGAGKSARPLHHRGEVERLVARLAVLAFDEAAASHAADIRVALERQGRKIGPYDSLIAGHARSRGLTVVTGNLGEFGRVDGLRAVSWS